VFMGEAWDLDLSAVLDDLYKLIVDRLEKKPPNSYTVQLASKGIDYVARKFGEESIEVIIAASRESKERLVSEIADLLYHLLVLMAVKGVSPEEVANELLRRRK